MITTYFEISSAVQQWISSLHYGMRGFVLSFGNVNILCTKSMNRLVTCQCVANAFLDYWTLPAFQNLPVDASDEVNTHEPFISSLARLSDPSMQPGAHITCRTERIDRVLLVVGQLCCGVESHIRTGYFTPIGHSDSTRVFDKRIYKRHWLHSSVKSVGVICSQGIIVHSSPDAIYGKNWKPAPLETKQDKTQMNSLMDAP